MKFRDFLRLHPMFPVVMIFAVAVAGTTFYLRQYTIAYFELLLGVVLSVVIILAERKNFNDLKKTVQTLNSHIVSDTDDRISSIPLPFVICSPNGSIVWYNDMFASDIIGDKDLSFKQIRNFIPADKLSSGEASCSFNANYNNKRYTVHISRLIDDKNENFVLYFIDDTYYKNIADKYKAERPAVILISVDAMEEISSLMAQNEYATLVGDAERMIMSWFTKKYMCIVRKVSEGKFFILAEYSVFEKMKENNFDILDSIRDHRLENVPTGITISIGIGTGKELSACDYTSRKAIDMAKGRGGDQVVINDNDNYEFFGGVAAGVESTNQVQSRIVAGSIEELIRHSDNVLIMGHKNSDLDSLGSAIGLSETVSHMGIRVRVVVDENTTMAKPLLDYFKDAGRGNLFVSPEKVNAEIQPETLLIITDVMRPSFTDAPSLIEKVSKIVVIDHHRMSVDHVSDAMIFFHEPNASSAGEMVTELVKYMPSKPVISKEGSEALLAGIYLDTKNFTLKTGVRTFETAAYLREHGADTITVRKLFSATTSENELVSKIVNSAEIKGRFAFAVTDIKDGSIRLACAKAADALLNIENVDASFVIFEANNSDAAISARSYGRINVQVIMEKLGGGGHQTMAAVQLPGCTIEDAYKALLDAVNDFASHSQKSSSDKAKKEVMK